MQSRYLVAVVSIPLIVLMLISVVHADPTEFTVGVVPQFEQRKLYKIWRPVLDRLEELSGLKLTLVGTAKIPEFEKLLMEGRFDIAYMNPYHLLEGHREQGYQPVVRDGDTVLKGILVVNKESPITDPSQLQGKIVAFPSPNALGASLLIRADLAKTYDVRVVPEYVKTHSSVYLHVAKNLVAAGAGVVQTLDAQDEEVRKKLRVIYQTRGITPHPIALHPRMPEADREKFISAILKMGSNKQDRELLEKIPLQNVTRTAYDDYKDLVELNLGEFYIK